MRLSDAIILGNAAFPACRGNWERGDAGCLITNALRAAGVYRRGVMVTLQAYDAWPWLSTKVTPTRDPLAPWLIESPISWITGAYDHEGFTAAEIAEAIRGLEDALGVTDESTAAAPTAINNPCEVTA